MASTNYRIKCDRQKKTASCNKPRRKAKGNRCKIQIRLRKVRQTRRRFRMATSANSVPSTSGCPTSTRTGIWADGTKASETSAFDSRKVNVLRLTTRSRVTSRNTSECTTPSNDSVQKMVSHACQETVQMAMRDSIQMLRKAKVDCRCTFLASSQFGVTMMFCRQITRTIRLFIAAKRISLA